MLHPLMGMKRSLAKATSSAFTDGRPGIAASPAAIHGGSQPGPWSVGRVENEAGVTSISSSPGVRLSPRTRDAYRSRNVSKLGNAVPSARETTRASPPRTKARSVWRCSGAVTSTAMATSSA